MGNSPMCVLVAERQEGERVPEMVYERRACWNGTIDRGNSPIVAERREGVGGNPRDREQA